MGSTTAGIGHADRVLSVDGDVLTATGLPPKTLKRWIARRKAEVVAAVESGLLSECEARARYNISREEFSAWLNAYDRDGVPGLRARATARGTRRRARPADFHAAPELADRTVMPSG